MKKFFLFAFLAVFLGMSNVAAAEEKDLAALKCSELLGADTTKRVAILFWMDGYLSAMSENTVMSDEWMKKLTTFTGEYCAKNPNNTIMQLMDDIPE